MQKRTITRTLILGALAAIFTAGLSAFSATPALAKQCVWNKGGYVLRVDWFNPGAMTWTENTADPDPVTRLSRFDLRFTEQPVQTDWVHLATGACIDRGPTQYWAILSICGYIGRYRVVEYPSNWPVTNRFNCGIWQTVTPSTTQYLDTWGGFGNPQSGPGGGI
jgi:hypothetical protein